jgi:predicted metalloenzyme YecM
MTTAPGTLVNLSRAIIAQFNIFCKEHGLIGFVQADHICIKCSSSDVYEGRRRELEFASTFIYQSIISERRISIIGLQQPIQTKVGSINYLELSDQKPDGSQVDKIDHIEIVPVTISYEELIQKLQNTGIALQEVVRPHHSTHDIILPSGFTIRLTREFLIDKIKREEMV